MCGRYYVSEEMKSELEKIVANLDKRIHGISFAGDIVPSSNAMILLPDNDNQIAAKECKWGYHINFSKQLIINARAETVASKKMFSTSLENRRCIIPAAGFYEWDVAKNKYTFSDQQKSILYMAGLYHKEEDADHFVIITTIANKSMETIHNRMPLIFNELQMKNWLYDNLYTENLLRIIPIDLKVNSENQQIKLEF